ncbi:flagellin [Candidatus Bathyarchaeota archaeon A05DMB-2]|jgi:flagellin FlaB|nr:flagellin [Candidatus Bathyarchaeota archaeon A05DMB-2]
MFLKKLSKSTRGIVGIEAAIVLIAFIIIAAALSYVVINMGFYTTQKTKETVQTGLDESLSALQLDGVVTARTNETSSEVLYLLVPAKLSAGKASVDLKNESIIVSVYLPNATFLNIYQGVESATDTTWDSLSTTLSLANQEAKFAIYNGDGDSVLESNEKAFLMIRLDSASVDGMVSDYQTVKIEVRTPKGAALTVVRTAPGGMPANSFIDLG